MTNKILQIMRTIANNRDEIDRLHALICLAEDWSIQPDDDDGISLHSILTQLSYHALVLDSVDIP